HRVVPGTRHLQSYEETPGDVILRDHLHGGGVHDREGVATLVGRALVGSKVRLPFVIVAGDQEFAVGRQGDTQGVHADLNGRAGGGEVPSVGKHAGEVAAQLVGAGKEFGSRVAPRL